MAAKTKGVRVRLLVARSGVAGAQNAGDEVEVSAAEAKRMIEAAQAEAIETTKKG